MHPLVASLLASANHDLRRKLSHGLPAMCLFVLPAALAAQTAHFGGAITILGSGFGYPVSVAVDASGDVFVADTINSAVYEIVAVSGVVSSTSTVNVIGNGFDSPQGVAVDATGNIFVADTNHNAVKEIVAVGGVVSSTSAVNTIGNGFASPHSVAVDANGNVFVADSNHNAVKQIVAVSGVVSSTSAVNVIGNGFNNPQGVAVDATGNVFVADTVNGEVKQIVAVSGVVSSSSIVNPVGSGFLFPSGVAVDASGNVFVADSGNNAAYEIVAVNGIVSSSSTVNTLGNGLDNPYGLALDRGDNVYIAERGNNRVVKLQPYSFNFGSLPVATSSPATITLTFIFDTTGTIGVPAVFTRGATGLDFTDAGTGTCNTAGTSHGYSPGTTCTVDVTFAPTSSGVRYGAATLKNSSGVPIADGYVSGNGTAPLVNFTPYTQTTATNSIPNAEGMGVDGSGNLFVATGASVYKLAYSAGSYGSPAQLFTSAFSIPFSSLQWVAVDGAGSLYLADGGSNNRIIKETPSNGGYTASLPCSSGCQGNEIAVDGGGNLYTLSAALNDVVKLTLKSDGSYSPPVTISTRTGNNPWSLVLDASGNVFYSDQGNGCLYELTPSGGRYTESQIDCTMNSPQGMAIDAGGNLYLTETGGDVVEYRLSGGTYSKVATPIITGLSNSTGVWFDPRGNLLVSNTGNGQILKLDLVDPPALSFASTAVGATSSDSPQTVTLTNSGNAALTFPAPAAGLNPALSSGFTLGTSSTCPQISTASIAGTLAAGASCTDILSFAPTLAGSISGSLAITDDTLNALAPGYATQSIALTGTATVGAAGTPTLAFTIPGHTYGDAPFTVTATSNSTGAFTYAVVSGPATVAGNIVSLMGTGNIVLQAAEAAAANYTAASINATFAVAAGTPTLAFSVPNHTYGDPSFAVTATSNSTGVVVYAVVSGPATVASNIVSLTGTGTVVLQASEAATANYAAASISASFAVAAGTPTLTFTVPNHTYGDLSFPVTAISNSTGAFTYAVVSGRATVAGNIVTLTGTGSIVLQASEAATSNYAAASTNATFAVAAGAPSLTFTVPNHTYGDPSFAATATSNSTGALAYAVVSGPATVAGNIVSLTGAGTVVLTASQSASGNYAAATISASFTVVPDVMLSSGASSPSETVAPGAAAIYALTFTPGGQATYPNELTFAVTGLPAGATAVFSPATIPAGSSAASLTLTIQTAQTSAQSSPKESHLPGTPYTPVVLGILLPWMAIRPRRRRLRCMPVLAAVLVLSMGVVLNLGGCGSSSTSTTAPVMPSQSYSLTVTATDAVTGLHSATTLTLVVQ